MSLTCLVTVPWPCVWEQHCSFSETSLVSMLGRVLKKDDGLVFPEFFTEIFNTESEPIQIGIS